ncbi:MAG: hypothetical protein AB7G37_20160 [Solirubrobacteraceae bacterium]
MDRMQSAGTSFEELEQAVAARWPGGEWAVRIRQEDDGAGFFGVVSVRDRAHLEERGNTYDGVCERLVARVRS